MPPPPRLSNWPLPSIMVSAGEIILWNLATDQQQTNFTARRSVVTSVAFAPDNSALATGSGWGGDDIGVDLWNLKQGRQDASTNINCPTVSLAFSPDGKTLATAGSSGINLWNTVTDQPPTALKGHIGAVLAVAFLPDGKSLLSCGLDRTMRLWPLPTDRKS